MKAVERYLDWAYGNEGQWWRWHLLVTAPFYLLPVFVVWAVFGRWIALCAVVGILVGLALRR